MGSYVVYHVNHLVHPQEMAEVPAELVRHRPRTVGQHIFHLPVIHQVMQASAQIRTLILLFARLSFPIEQHHIVRLALEEVVPVGRIGIPTVACVFQYIHAFIKQDERIGIGMRVVPRLSALHGQHRRVLFPRIAHHGPAEIGKQARSSHVRHGGCLTAIRHVKESHRAVTEIAVAMLPLLYLVDVPQDFRSPYA